MSNWGTYILYILTFITAIIFSFFSQEKRMTQQRVVCYRLRLNWFILSFAMLWIISCFTKIGADYDSYIRIVRVSGKNSVWTGEVGFNYLCAFLKIFCGTNYDAAIFLLKTITLLIFFKAIYELRKDIKISWAVFAFVMLSYLRFYLVSMHLSCALVLLSVTYLFKRKNKKAILIYFISFTIHYSSLFLAPAYILFFIISTLKRISKLQIFLLMVGYFLVFISVYQIYDFALSNFSVFQNYKDYHLITNYSGLGIMQFIFYIPIFYFVIMIYKCSENKILISLSIVFSFTGFLFALLGYRMEVISRMYEYFLCLYMIMVPVIIFDRKNGYELKKRKFLLSIRDDQIIWTIYILFRGMDILLDVLPSSSTSNLSNWQFFWPF